MGGVKGKWTFSIIDVSKESSEKSFDVFSNDFKRILIILFVEKSSEYTTQSRRVRKLDLHRVKSML